jgi:hypothetical protein
MIQHDLTINLAIQHLATVAVLKRDVDRAARLSGYLAAWYRARGIERRRAVEPRTYDMLIVELRTLLSDGRLAQLAELGAQLSQDDAVAEALPVAPPCRAADLR